MAYKTKDYDNPKVKEKYRANARTRYERLKNNPEFKAKRKVIFSRWLNKNREHFNDLCREPNRIRASKTRAQRKKDKVCVICGGEIDQKKYVNCDECRIKCSIIKKNYYAKNREVCRAKQKIWRDNNKDKIKAYHKRYYNKKSQEKNRK